jgi:lysine 6-dehydrogenase
MKNIAVFGIGRMGKAIIYDLCEFQKENVQIICIDQDKKMWKNLQLLKWFESKAQDIKFVQFNFTKSDQMKSLLLELFRENNIGLAFGAMDYSLNVLLTEVAIETKSHFLDLGGNPSIVEKQFSLNNSAKEAGVTIIPDCGLAPGMANVLAYYFIKKFNTLESCHIKVGGLPQEPKSILKYQQVFSIRGLTNEYLEDAIIIKDGQLIKVESLTDVEEFIIEGIGRLEAFHTAGGTSNLPKLLNGKIKHLTYKTIRYPGHIQYFQFLKEYGFLEETLIEEIGVEPRKFTEKLLESNFPDYANDLVIVLIEIKGIIDSRNLIEQWKIIDCHDTKTGFSSMARTTAYPISILGQMILSNSITNRGVIEGETVGSTDDFIEELKKRNIILSKI